MILSPGLCRQGGLNCRFLVHILKITRLPSQLPDFESIPSKDNASPDSIRLTVLYGSKQVILGSFIIIANECTINQKLACVLNLTKSEAPSKLHIYIDQACSSGLTGHLALDLKEFIHESNIEVYLKYPLCPNSFNGHGGPILKMTIQNMGKEVDGDFDESELLVFQPRSLEACHDNRLQGPMSSQGLSMTHLVQLEDALSNLDEKLKVLALACKEAENSQASQNLSYEVDTQSSTNSPLFSSLQTGTSVDSCSELYDVGSEDILDLYPDCPRASSLLSKHARTFSDISSLASSSTFSNTQLPRHERNKSMGKVTSHRWPSPLEGRTDDNHGTEDCVDDCLICSMSGLRLYEGISSSVGSNNAVSLLQEPSYQSSLLVEPHEGFLLERSEEEEVRSEAVVKKRPSFLKGLVGAAVVAGVSFFGLRNANLAQRNQTGADYQAKSKGAISSKYSGHVRGRLSRSHYSFKF